jgi:hypothetical protein
MTVITVWLIFPWVWPIGIFLGFLLFLSEKYKVIKQIREEKEYADICERYLKETERYMDKETYRKKSIAKFDKFKV